MYRKVFGVPTSALTEEDLRSLIDREVSEGPHLDYKTKEDFDDKARGKEVAKDAAAFANAYGGYLIYGMEEEGGLPKALVGMELADPDRSASAIENAVRDRTEPAVEVHAQPVRLESGRYAIVVEVPPSLNAPHMADGRFYRRAGRSSAPMEYMDVRRAFTEKGDVVRKMRERFERRVEGVRKGYGPTNYWSSSWSGVFLYAASIPAFEAVQTRILGPEARAAVGSLSIFGNSWSTQFCAEGLIASPDSHHKSSTFALITHEGELLHGVGPLEAFWHCEREGESPACIEVGDLQRETLKLLRKNLRHLVGLGFDPPYYLALAIVNARSHVLRASGRPEYDLPTTTRHVRHPFLLFDQLLLDEDVRIVAAPEPSPYDQEAWRRHRDTMAARLQPILDRLYQAAGAEYSRVAHALDGEAPTP